MLSFLVMKKETYNYRKDHGLCVWCQTPTNGTVLCDNCKKRDKERKVKNREYALKAHICPRCGKNKVVVGICCTDCLDKQAEYRDKNKEEINRKQRITYASKYQELKENGVCTKCRKRKAKAGKTMCELCLSVKREYRNNHYKNCLDRNERPSYGLCYYCGEKLDGNWKICSKCRERCMNNLPSEHHRIHYWDEDNKIVFLKK